MRPLLIFIINIFLICYSAGAQNGKIKRLCRNQSYEMLIEIQQGNYLNTQKKLYYQNGDPLNAIKNLNYIRELLQARGLPSKDFSKFNFDNIDGFTEKFLSLYYFFDKHKSDDFSGYSIEFIFLYAREDKDLSLISILRHDPPDYNDFLKFKNDQ